MLTVVRGLWYTVADWWHGHVALPMLTWAERMEDVATLHERGPDVLATVQQARAEERERETRAYLNWAQMEAERERGEAVAEVVDGADRPEGA